MEHLQQSIYADWTKPNAAGWKTVLLEYAITPIQQYSYTVGRTLQIQR
jgi:hypothetical protein